MSAKSIFEADGKAILNYHLTRAPVIKPTPLPAQATHNPPAKLATIHFEDGDDVKGVLDAAEATFPFLLQPGAKFVAKPGSADQAERQVWAFETQCHMAGGERVDRGESKQGTES